MKKHKRDGMQNLAIFAGSLSDLRLLDFSLLNVKFLDLSSKELETYIEDVCKQDESLDNVGFFRELGKTKNDYDHYKFEKYAAIPIDFDQINNEASYREIELILRIVYPSDISIIALVPLIPNEENSFSISLGYPTQFRSSYAGNSTEYSKRFLQFGPSKAKYIKAFTEIWNKKKSSRTHLNEVIHPFYNQSFDRDQIKVFAFLSLCICLEAIVQGKNELTYRIRRNVSIICGETVEECKVLFDNIDEIYKLRSTIVHGDPADFSKIHDCYPVLEATVSSMIINLIEIGIYDITNLNSLLTEAGFGDRPKFGSVDISSIINTKNKSKMLCLLKPKGKNK